MYYNDYLKIELASPKISIGNPLLNVKPILDILDKSKSAILLFPELTVTGYTAHDLFFQDEFIKNAYKALDKIMNETKYKGIYILGMPILVDDILFNTALVIKENKILGSVPKFYLPNSKEFLEKRWFQPGILSTKDEITILNQKVPFGKIIFEDNKNDIRFGVEVCQDMWALNTLGDELTLNGAHFILNPSASTEILGKPDLRLTTIKDASRRQHSAYFYTTSNYLESTNDFVFTNHKIVGLLGNIVLNNDLFKNDLSVSYDLDVEYIRYQRRIDQTYKDEQTKVKNDVKRVLVSFDETKEFKFSENLNKTPFIPLTNSNYHFKLINEIQTLGLMNKLKGFYNPKGVIGVSGGLDSTLALIVAHQAFKRLNLPLKNIIGVTMPTHITSQETNEDSLLLMDKLNINGSLIDIDNEVKEQLKLLNHDDKDTTFENIQARIRTNTLMNLANKHNGLVLGTGDMSEIALGFMTYNGDQMSMYNVNGGIPKTLVKALIDYHLKNDYHYIKELLNKILNKKISPELIKNQDTESIIGKYEINDFILYHHLEQGASQDKLTWLVKETFNLTSDEANSYTKRFFNRFYNSQFKRMPMPEGPKVLSFSLSPRSDYKMSSMIKRS